MAFVGNYSSSLFQPVSTATSEQQLSMWCALAASQQQPVPLAEKMLGRLYEVRREGQAASFTLLFQAGGRLVVNLQGQVLEENWQQSTWNPSSLILGGRTMPAAEVVVGLRNFGNDPNELWEPSPPMGATPLVGTWRNAGEGMLNTGGPGNVALKLDIIVDRSGSMQPLHSATVQGLNGFLAEQRSLPHASSMTMRLITFDDRIETPWPEGTQLTDTSFTVSPAIVQPRGQTALLDAIGTALSGTALLPLRVVCIVTDGFENSSRRFTKPQVNALITARKDAGWTFIFLASNQDAIQEGAALGINAGSCATFSNTAEGIAGGFGSASAASCRGSMFGQSAATFSSTERAACLGRLS